MKKIASNINFLKKLLTNVNMSDIIKEMKEKNIEIVHFF